jgi:predicted nucleic acid-binding protein
MTVKAIYENGVFRPQEPVHLAERTEVEVLIPATTSPDIDDPTGWKAAEALIVSSTTRRPTWPSSTTTISTASRRCDLPRHGIPLRSRLEARRPPSARRRSLPDVQGSAADHLLTTNHVIAETITLTRKIGHDDAARLGDQLYGEKLARIHWASPDEERAAFDYFKRHQEQTYSAVDSLSFVIMEKLSIRETLAVDSDFTHRFIARPGPQRG